MREDWVEEELGNIFFTTSGGTPSRKNANYYSGEIPWVKSGELDQGIIRDTEEKITQKAIENSSAKVFPKGTLLIALYGATIGKLAFLGVEAATNQAICGIFKNPLVDSNYLFYFLLYRRPKLISQGTGGAQPNISQTILKKLEVPLSPLPEQRAIVNKIETLFSALDQGIADLNRAKEQLKVYRQAVLKKAFEGELTKMKNKPKIVDLGTVIDKPKYGTSKKCSLDSAGKAVLRIPNIGDGIIKTDELKYAQFDQKEISLFELKEGDLLTIRSNGSVDLVGKCARITKNDTDYLFAGYLIRLRPNLNLIDSKYLLYCLTSHDLRVQIEFKAKSTSGVNNINSGELESLKIPIFELKEQHQIVREIESRLSVCDEVENNIAQSLKKAEALRQSILKKAFEGTLLSEEERALCKLAPDYEPASVLLERIREEKKQPKVEHAASSKSKRSSKQK